MSRVGIIGDSHIPYCLEGYMEFCQETFEAWNCDTFVHIGDLIDHHALSFHDSEPMLQGAHGELMDARDKLQPWYEAFPKLTICNGNHDLIPARQLKKIGMDAEVWMKPLKEIYEMPKGWNLVETLVIDDVLYHHGGTASGVNGFRKDAESRMRSTVTGHNHSNFGVSYTATDQELVYGLAVGCGVDNAAMAFAYGKHFQKKPVVGCGVVIDGVPYAEPMDLGKKLRRM
jgi:predicted phosphodiesterase